MPLNSLFINSLQLGINFIIIMLTFPFNKLFFTWLAIINPYIITIAYRLNHKSYPILAQVILICNLCTQQVG